MTFYNLNQRIDFKYVEWIKYVQENFSKPH